tara:strand:+ start:2426 stop:5176 length:2751 start_codon:yes stop_codon:yes gene_type:complete
VGRRLAKLADDFVSRMARTKADYEDTNYYHGTGAHIKEGFIPSESGNLGGGVYLTPNPDSASKRAVLSKYRNRDKGKNPNVLQTRIRNDLSFFDMNENPFMDLDINKLKEQGYDGVRRFDDDVLQEINVFDPSNIRSVNAMFDPAKKGSSDLLASTIPAALGIGALATGEDAEAGVITKNGKRIIEAWHGTPHSFDKFNMSKLGSGEGAQAYGHGMYTADSRSVAEGYKGALTGRQARDSFLNSLPEDADFEDVIDLLGSGEFTESQEKVIKALKADDWLGFDYPSQAIDATYRNLDRYDASKELVDAVKGEGSLYKVNIDATPEEMLDWDLPLSEQSQVVQDIAADVMGLDTWDSPARRAFIRDKLSGSGEQLKSRILEAEGSEEAASSYLSAKGIKGIQYSDAMSRGAEGGTKNYVTFDDKLMEIVERGSAQPGLLSGIAAGTAGLGALAGGEDAEAGPLAAGGRRIIDARFSGPVGSGSVRKGVTPTLEGMETSIAPRNMDMGGDYSLYDFEGSPYLLTQSDRSAAGGEITSVHGTQINPVDLRGGRDFMFDPKSKGQVWASDPNVVKSMSKRAQELYLQYGENPLLLPYSMAPTGIDFATMPLDTMVNYARERMSKANINKLDKRIREVIPEWKGVSDPTANAVFRDVKGPARKKVADIIDKDFREVNGGMSISEGRAATTASDQYIVPEGNIKNIGRIDTSAALPSESGHPTYRGSLPGEGIGTLTNEINARPFMAQNGRELTGDSADIRSLSMNHGFGQGIIDEKLLRSIYGAAQPGLLAGIAAGTAGGLGIASAYTQAERDANQRDLQALQRVDEQGEQERLDAEYAKHPQLDQFAQQLNQITTPSKNIDPNLAMTVGGLSNPLLTAYGLMTSESPLAGFTEYLRRMGADRSTWGRLKDSANGALDILP